jgi:formylglycine-generating enzyme required for sulfatase activity
LEAEWEVVATGAPIDGIFADSGRFHPASSVKCRASSASEASPHASEALFGDVWEWTASPYAPYPGYRPWSSGLGEYNGKFVQPDGAARRFVRHASVAHPRGLPQLLPAGRAVAVQRDPSSARLLKECP